MTLVSTDGVVGVITKLHEESPEAAAVLYRLALYESLADQIEEHRPEMEATVLKNMAEINAAARRSMLRSHVGKALEGEEEPDDLAYAEGLAILEEYVSKSSLVGWALDAFNRRVNRDEQGRFAPRGQHAQGPQEALAHPGQRQQQAAVDLMGMTLGANQRQGDRMTRNLFDDQGNVKRNGQQIANDWYGASDGVNRQSYNRMRLTGQALAGMSAPGSVAHTVGSIAELAGNLGPEAETVLGPGIRRTAYRYRGTERRPEKSITTAVSEASVYAAGLSGTPEQEAQAHRMMTSAQSQKGQRDPAVAVAQRWAARDVSSDKRALSVRGDAAVAAMLAVDGQRHESVLPNLDLVRLSLESGEMPPSQGVIIDSEGQVTTQAVGYNGDHYLPFDLRNLNALHGGQYVRSRATGGLTTEDIYTGLLTGARQVQVVSNSGVFTLEFDPELRGGRRYNDKARRMIQRYGAMLETIGNPESDLFEPGADLPPEQVSELRTRAANASRTEKDFQTNFNNLRREARLKASFSEADMSEIDEAATNVGRTRARQEARQRADAGRPMSRQEVAQLAEEEARAYKRENQPTVRKLKLDGIGYNQAMQALKQEFPYFIRRADFTPLPKWLDQYGFSNNELGYRENAPSDLGYVQPGQTNTQRAQTGARRVPTRQNSRGGAAAAAATAEGSAAPKAGGAEGAAAPKAEGGKQVSLQDIARPDSPFMRQANNSALALASAMRKVSAELPMDVDDEYILSNFDNFEYVQWKMQKLRGQHGDSHSGQAFVSWLIGESSPVQREAVRLGLEDLVHERETNKDWASLPSPEQMRAQVGEILTAYDVLHPFLEVPQGTNPIEVGLDAADAKPPKMPGTPELTQSDEDFDYAERNMRLDSGLDNFLNGFEGISNLERLATVENLANTYHDENTPANEQRLTDALTAWSFLHARELREHIKPYLGAPGGGGAAPFGKAAKPRRRLVFAKSDPFFSSLARTLGSTET